MYAKCLQRKLYCIVGFAPANIQNGNHQSLWCIIITKTEHISSLNFPFLSFINLSNFIMYSFMCFVWFKYRKYINKPSYTHVSVVWSLIPVNTDIHIHAYAVYMTSIIIILQLHKLVWISCFNCNLRSFILRFVFAVHVFPYLSMHAHSPTNTVAVHDSTCIVCFSFTCNTNILILVCKMSLMKEKYIHVQ